MKKRIIIIFSTILICSIAAIGIIFFVKVPKSLDYEKVAAILPESRMLEFDETYYFNGSEAKEDMVTGTVWRVDYNGHVSAFKFLGGSDWVDYVEFNLSQDDTQEIWEYADSLEGDYVPKGYEGYAYGSVLYKYNDKGEKTIKSFFGLPVDYPLAKEIYTILSDNYKNALDNQ